MAKYYKMQYTIQITDLYSVQYCSKNMGAFHESWFSSGNLFRASPGEWIDVSKFPLGIFCSGPWVLERIFSLPRVQEPSTKRLP
jgi:hypothetical protein